MSNSPSFDTVRVRFPPSPTGSLHLGNARTFLMNWLFARQHGGNVILRIEDTDIQRSEQKYEMEIVEALKWLGLDWDEGPDWTFANGEWKIESKGEYGPYRQSERAHIYERYVESLLSSGYAYYCYCTKEELEAERQSFLAQGLPPKYSGHCRSLAAPPHGKSLESIRFKTPSAHVVFKDLVRGTITFDAELFGDFIIAKDLRTVLYNFANVVDDYEMKISHVIRGEEHVANTPKQILMQKALGFAEPVYAHLPLILAPNRSKLSKRYADVALLSYRNRGYLPEATANFLALLGWHPQDNREVLSRDELTKSFNLKRVQKAGAIFNEEKLDWLNGEYIKRMPRAELADRIEAIAAPQNIAIARGMLEKLVGVFQERMRTLVEFFELAHFFMEMPVYSSHLLAWKGESMAATREALEEAMSALDRIPEQDFTASNARAVLEPLVEVRGRGSVYWPLRVALSGQAASPDPLTILEILGKEESMKRLTAAINMIGLAL